MVVLTVAKKVKIEGRDYVSLSSAFFIEAMDKIHNGNEYDEHYIPEIRNTIIQFSKSNGCDIATVLVPIKMLSWMEVEYNKTPLPWRDTYSQAYKARRQNTYAGQPPSR
jgi:hypothetical protein